MRHKVFKMVSGRLEFVGIRELRDGDAIIEGQTSMAETVHTVQLRESRLNDLNLEILAGLSGKEKEDFKRGLRIAGIPDPEGRAALRESFRRLHPEWTEAQLEVAVKGR